MIGNVGSAAAAPSGSAAAGSAGGQLGKNEFLKMLVAQLKNQDPLQPSNGQELAAQLAHFSSVEQLTQIKDLLGGQGTHISDLAAAISTTGAQALLGKSVEAFGEHVYVTAGGPADVKVVVGSAGGSAMLRLFDSTGREVGSRELGTLRGGEQTVDLGSLTSDLKSGWYTYAVDVSDGSGAPVPVQKFTAALVDGVRFGAGGPLLTAGELLIPYEAVSRVAR